MDFNGLTLLSTKGLAERLAQDSGVGIPAYSYGSLKALSQKNYPFVIRKAITPGSKKPKVTWVYEWFMIWLLEGNEAVKDSIQRNTVPQIEKYLESLIKKPVGRPTKLDEKKDDLLRVIGGKDNIKSS